MYTAVAVCLYNCPEPTLQLYRQGKVAAMEDEGGFLCFWKNISSLYATISNKKPFFNVVVTLCFSCRPLLPLPWRSSVCCRASCPWLTAPLVAHFVSYYHAYFSFSELGKCIFYRVTASQITMVPEYHQECPSSGVNTDTRLTPLQSPVLQ